jgi:Tfp pilus assembly protein PilF
MLSSRQVLVILLSLVFLAILTGCNGFLSLYSPQSAKRVQADALITDAAERLAADDFKGNVRLLKEAAKVDPTYRRAWMKLCEGYQLTEELDLAVESCKHMIELDPSGLSHNSLGLVYLAKRDYSQAAREFEIATKDSQIPIVHYNLVWALLGSGQYEEAVAAARRMIEVSASDPSNLRTAYEMLAAAYAKLGQKNKEKEVLERLRTLDPSLKDIKSCEVKPDAKGELSLNCHN